MCCVAEKENVFVSCDNLQYGRCIGSKNEKILYSCPMGNNPGMDHTSAEYIEKLRHDRYCADCVQYMMANKHTSVIHGTGESWKPV